MANFRYYVVDLFDGIVKGANELEEIQDYVNCDDYYVIDTENGTWLTHEEPVEIKHIEDTSNESEDEG